MSASDASNPVNLFRYTVEPIFPDGAGFRIDPEGDWVRFDDVWPELQQLRALCTRETYRQPFAGLLSWGLRPDLPHCELSIRFQSVEAAQAAREYIRDLITPVGAQKTEPRQITPAVAKEPR